MKLPEIAKGHTHYKEWQVRRRSCSRLLGHLAAKKQRLDILEIGCGNGWLSHRLAALPGTKVTGLDINFTELQQAARVFNDDPNLDFIHGDIRTGILEDRRYDDIVFAAAIQYFPSLKKLIHYALSFLKPGGEIHIMDTHFYRPGEIAVAKRKTFAYYSSLGYPEMADFYFHHNADDLRSFHHSILYNPNNLRNRWIGTKDPFPWICIRERPTMINF
jgi:SAM-dependent methyltransferase